MDFSILPPAELSRKKEKGKKKIALNIHFLHEGVEET